MTVSKLTQADNLIFYILRNLKVFCLSLKINNSLNLMNLKKY